MIVEACAAKYFPGLAEDGLLILVFRSILIVVRRLDKAREFLNGTCHFLLNHSFLEGQMHILRISNTLILIYMPILLNKEVFQTSSA